jgi:ParB-like nuclease domain
MVLPKNRNAARQRSEPRRVERRPDVCSIATVALDQIKPHPRNPRTHSKKQVRQIADSIQAVGFASPVLLDEHGVLLAGHGRLEAAKLLRLKAIPAIVVDGLSEARKRALLLADNRIAQSAGWDRERLASELISLPDLLIDDGLDITLTGFEPAEIDALLADFEDDVADPADTINPTHYAGPAVNQPGDFWQLGKHRLLCGDAREASHLNRLLGRERAHMAFLDPPYNVRVRDIGGRGQVKHQEFAMASGEMSQEAFTAFLTDVLSLAAHASADGAVHFVCMDWRHISELVAAGGAAYDAMLNLIAWVKSNAGQGSFYLPLAARTHWRVSCGELPSPQHHRPRPPWPLALQCLEICRRQHISRWPHERPARAPDGEAGRTRRRCDQRRHPTQSSRARYFQWLRHDAACG